MKNSWHTVHLILNVGSNLFLNSSPMDKNFPKPYTTRVNESNMKGTRYKRGMMGTRREETVANCCTNREFDTNLTQF